jgi:hypothetical protein
MDLIFFVFLPDGSPGGVEGLADSWKNVGGHPYQINYQSQD